MASLTSSLSTDATGPLALAHELSEADAQRIFAALLGLAAPITDEKGEQRPRKLGECLTDRVNGFVHGLLADVDQYEKQEAMKAALAKIAEPIKVEVKQ